MRMTAHQPMYMPWLGLLHKISQADVFVSWDDVQMEDSGFENRNRILGPNGVQFLTVPVKRSRETHIKDLLICNDQPWKRKHLRTIELAYHAAPYWDVYSQFFRVLYAQDWTHLAQINTAILVFLFQQFQLSPQYHRLSDLEVPAPDPSSRIVEACRKVGAWHYLFGAMGRDYADLPAFRSAGIDVWAQDYQSVPYQQLQPGFVPNLWAFDVLLNLGAERAREVMLSGGTVKRMA